MKVELTRFRVKKGKELRAKEWMAILNERMSEVLDTLEDEQMYVENIFEETVDEYMYLYWFSIQGEGGAEVKNSDHDIDKIHIQFWKECIDETYKGVDLSSVVTMIPKRVSDSF